MYHVVWEYEVRSDGVETFQSLYGPEGPWPGLFRAAEAYRGTELYRDTTRPNRFVTLDRWTSRAACEAFLAGVRDAYARIDREGEALTTGERRLGAFETDWSEVSRGSA